MPPTLPELSFKAAAAAISLIFAAVVLSGGPRRSANQFLAGFLLLIAGNQGAEVMRGLAWTSPEEAFWWWRVASVCAALDPLALYYFVSIFPSRNALNDTWKVSLVLVPGALLAATAAFPPGAPEPPWWFHTALGVYTCAVYTLALHQVVRTLRGEEAAEGRGPLAGLYVALCVAAIPLWERAPRDAFHHAWAFGLGPTERVAWTIEIGLGLLPVAAPLLAWRLGRAAAPKTRRRLMHGALVGALVATFLGFGWSMGDFARLIGRPDAFHALDDMVFHAVGALFAPIRWALFGFFTSVAVLRHDMLGMPLATRRVWARVLVALGFLAAALLALLQANAAFGRGDPALRPSDLVILGIVLAASQGFRRLVDRVAARGFGVPLPGDHAVALDAYRAGALQAAREGRVLAADPALARLREELGLDARSALVIHGLVEAAVPSPLSVGEVVSGRYRVVRLLGRGGAGRAFLALDGLLSREVVLKEVPERDAAGEEAAFHEARVAGGLRHPNVLTVHDLLPRHGGVLLVLEHAPGGSLEDGLARTGRLPLPEALRVAEGVLAGLEAAHARGIVHCDLKASNVLLAEDGSPKISDFGVARVRRGVTVGFNEPGAYAGTPETMAPEQRAGATPTPATDLYAVGLLLRRIAPEPLPGGLAQVVDRALEEDPARRWRSAREMREGLRGAAVTAPSP